MPSPILSFCIPTFNRSKMVRDCVEHLLKYSGNEIEIVVCDNASSDDTREKILSLNDPRIKYFRNDRNIFSLNLGLVLLRANGDFRFLLSDEDTVVLESIPIILERIRGNPNVAIIFGSIVGTYNYVYGDKIYQKGFEALRKFGFCSHRHMYCSGAIYNSKYIDPTHDLFNHMGPHVFLNTHLCIKADVLSMKDIICLIDNRRINVDYGLESLVEAHKKEYSFDSMLTFFRRFLATLVPLEMHAFEKTYLTLSLLFEFIYWGAWDRVLQVKDYAYRRFYAFEDALEFDPFVEALRCIDHFSQDIKRLVIDANPQSELSEYLALIKHFYTEFYRINDTRALFQLLDGIRNADIRHLIVFNAAKAAGFAGRFRLPLKDIDLYRHNLELSKCMGDYLSKKYGRLLRLNDDTIESCYCKGRVYNDLNDHKNSRKFLELYFEKASLNNRHFRVRAYDHTMNAYYFLGIALSRAGLREQAIACLENANRFSTYWSGDPHNEATKVLNKLYC